MSSPDPAGTFTGIFNRSDHGHMLFTTDVDPGIPEAKQGRVEMPGLWVIWFEPQDTDVLRAVYRIPLRTPIIVTFAPPRHPGGHPVAIEVAAAVV